MESWFSNFLRALGFSGDAARVSEIVVRKSAHIFEFTVLFLLLALLIGAFTRSRKRVVLISAAACFVSAVCDELLQIVSKRGASFRDVLIDSAGTAAGALLYMLFSRLRRNSCSGKTEKAAEKQ